MRSDIVRRFAGVSRRFPSLRLGAGSVSFAGLLTFICLDDVFALAAVDGFVATVLTAARFGAGAGAISMPNICERSSLASTFTPTGREVLQQLVDRVVILTEWQEPPVANRLPPGVVGRRVENCVEPALRFLETLYPAELGRHQQRDVEIELPVVDTRRHSAEVDTDLSHGRRISGEIVFMNDEAAVRVTYPERVRVSRISGVGSDPRSVRIRSIDGHQVLGAGQDEHVRLDGVLVPRQPLVGLAGNRGKGKAPSDAERTIAGARVIRQRELRSESRTARAGGDRHRHRAGARDRVGRKLLADTANRPPALGKGYRRRCEAKRLLPALRRRGVTASSRRSRLRIHRAGSRQAGTDAPASPRQTARGIGFEHGASRKSANSASRTVWD